MSDTESYISVWDAIADTPEEAANLRARAELMQKIAAIIKENGWAQARLRLVAGSLSLVSATCCAGASLDFRSTRW
jgi:predicted XRE-type DNA-binding protein